MTDRERLAAILAGVNPKVVKKLANLDYWLTLADAALKEGVTVPPPAPPQPTWTPGYEARAMMVGWSSSMEDGGTFLRRLYTQLHRDRVAALPGPTTSPEDRSVIVSLPDGEVWYADRSRLLALAEDIPSD